jgi:glycosyltransferase involved in cell wall biosynthesis
VLHGDEEHYYALSKKYKNLLALHICVSNRVRRNLLAYDPTIDERSVLTIPCGIPLPAFLPRAAEGGKLEILYVGRISQWGKRILDIPSVCAALRSRGVDFRLTVIGSGDEMPELKARVQKLGLSMHFRFLGWLKKEDTLEHMQRADTLLLTSDFEGMPVAVMEALSCGCGVVATRVSGMEDYAKSQFAPGCFWVYATGDIEKGAACLAESAVVSKRTRSEQARRLAESEFSIKLCRERYLHAFEHMQHVRQADSTVRLSSIGRFGSYCVSLSRYIRVSASKYIGSAKLD